jgi:hypothetical protein
MTSDGSNRPLSDLSLSWAGKGVSEINPPAHAVPRPTNSLVVSLPGSFGTRDNYRDLAWWIRYVAAGVLARVPHALDVDEICPGGRSLVGQVPTYFRTSVES